MIFFFFSEAGNFKYKVMDFWKQINDFRSLVFVSMKLFKWDSFFVQLKYLFYYVRPNGDVI